MNHINGNEVGTYDGIITIIKSNVKNKCKAKEIVLSAMGTDDDKFISLNDCLKKIKYKEGDIVTVIIDDATHGEIYQYGNYKEKQWCEHGSTKGYA